MKNPKFSICIPNYNYEKYLGKTIKSVLNQGFRDLEVIFVDDCSKDDSLRQAREIKDKRLKIKVNPVNLGFAGNVNKTAEYAQGKIMIMLSSDDLMLSEALKTYDFLFKRAGDDIVVSSAVNVVDSEDKQIGEIDANKDLWKEKDRDFEMEKIFKTRIYKVESKELLRRCLLRMKNPFNFASTAYSKKIYEQIRSYGARLINPDKWFNWKLLEKTKYAYFIDKPLFAYRWHSSNQTAQQTKSGALKYLIDEYTSTFEIKDDLLKSLKLTREDLARAFIEYDIARHGLRELAKSGWKQANRVRNFGFAAYPGYAWRNKKIWFLSLLLIFGPFAKIIAKRLYSYYKRNLI